MEMIVGCIFLAALIAFLAIYLKNATIVIKLEYPEIQAPELDDLYDDNGDPKGVKDIADFDELLKEINDLMLDQEDDSNE